MKNNEDQTLGKAYFLPFFIAFFFIAFFLAAM